MSSLTIDTALSPNNVAKLFINFSRYEHATPRKYVCPPAPTAADSKLKYTWANACSKLVCPPPPRAFSGKTYSW